VHPLTLPQETPHMNCIVELCIPQKAKAQKL
jgi:hypothetical protein